MVRGHFLMTQVSKSQGTREWSFGFLIQTLARRIDATMKKELAKEGVDVKIFANLMVLAEKDGINQRQLGEKLDFPEYYTSRNVDALVHAGFAERRPDPSSRRSMLVFMTKAGREKAKKLPVIVRRVNEQYLKELSKEDRDQIIMYLQSIAGINPSGQSDD